jgi:hypothetical protein
MYRHTLIVKVLAQGTTDDVQMAKFVATVLKLTPYKPAMG